jgi:DNA-binding MarR family transcriptional regulator
MTNYSPNSNSKRPLPPKETVRRMVESLANNSPAKSTTNQEHPHLTKNQVAVSQDIVRGVIWAWQARAGYFPRELLSDPAWGMLLELLHGELAGQRVGLSTLCEAAGAPESTAVRWLKALEGHDFVMRRTDPLDSESDVIELTSRGSNALRRYFRDILSNG